MKAIRFTEYGSPDVLELQEVEKPTPGEGQVLIQVHAAAANPLDWHAMRGAPFLIRLGGGFFKPKSSLLGADVAGRIEAVGKNATQFKVGDEVYGEIHEGSFAEYACAKQELLALKPVNVSFEEAAAVPVAGFTALQGLRDKGQIRAGQKVVINGAAGGVGSFAVQIAKAYGTEVTGVCSTRNLEMVRSIGADHVVDYTKQDFTKSGQQYDLIYDAIGNLTVSDMKRALTPEGIGSVAGFTTFSNLIRVVLLGGKRIGLMGVAQPNQKDLYTLKDMIEAGKIVPLIDRCYPLSETAQAIGYLEQGHARGKVIIVVDRNR